MSKERELAVTLSEIKASPEGPSVCAFFDFDGTLIKGFSAGHMSKERFKERDISLDEVFDTVRVAINASVGKADFEDLMNVAAQAWEGREHAELEKMGDSLFKRKVVNLVFPEMRKIVKAHQDKGHTVVLSSSATCYQVEAAARYFGIEHVLCNRFTVGDDGLLTGTVEAPVLWGKGKATVAQQFCADHDLDIKKAYFYADGDEDVALMYLVGKPRPTNPGKRLESVAKRRGWPIQRFHSREQSGKLRSMAGMATLVPAALAGVSVGLAKRDKWAGLNTASPLWLDNFFKVHRISFNVLGEDNLWSHRPAVFIFNHRTNYDALMVSRLVEKDFTAVSKKENEDHWLVGNLGKLMDVAFIDRSDGKSSVDALKPIEDLARRGISIMLAPEGTRVSDAPLGPFKKGAFRIAMGVGIPIVPIVIRNAEDVGARDAPVPCAGTVDIAVLPPIDTSDWTLRNYVRRIEQVRQLYLDMLDNWPGSDEELLSLD